MLAVFLLRLGGLLKKLVCPPLPGRCSDRTDCAGRTGSPDKKQDMKPDMKQYRTLERKNINLLLSVRLYWEGTGRISLETDLADSGSPFYFPRGIYQVEEYCLKIRDWCGFFEYRIPGDTNRQITVYPASRYLGRGVPVRRDSLPEKKAFVSWMKDRDFYDARPYFPGDDPRRINWKMLARHDELFIKEGNSLSPSKKSALLIFDASGSVEDTDSLLRRMKALSEELTESGLHLTLIVPEQGLIRDFETYTISEKEDLFASILPVPLKFIKTIPEGGYGILYFFSSGKPGQTILRDLDSCCAGSRKNMILPQSVRIEKRDLRKGWNIVQP